MSSSLNFLVVRIKCKRKESVEKDWTINGGACVVMVIVVGNGHGDTSSNPGLITFHIALIPLGKVWIQLFSLQLWVNSRADWVLQPWWGN